MSLITTHVLDTSRGRPASRVLVALELRSGNAWRRLAKAHTDTEGRATMVGTAEGTVHGTPIGTSASAAGGSAWPAGTYRLVFDTGAYFRANGVEPFFPEVTVAFEARDAAPEQHYHVPLLLSPFGYSTYRGS
jgi:5-hydroxyisourate hydrolase